MSFPKCITLHREEVEKRGYANINWKLFFVSTVVMNLENQSWMTFSKVYSKFNRLKKERSVSEIGQCMRWVLIKHKGIKSWE